MSTIHTTDVYCVVPPRFTTMKFGQNFHQQLVPEWEPFYVNYDLLKKLVKTGLATSSPCDFTGLLASMLSFFLIKGLTSVQSYTHA